MPVRTVLEIIAGTVLFGTVAGANAQQNAAAPLPATHGKSLSGNEVTLPAPDRPQTLIIAGFSKSSSAPVKAWWEKSEALCKAHPLVACYRVAVLEDVPGFIRGMVLKGMKRDLPPAQQGSFVTVFENEQAWKRTFGYAAADDAYLALFDDKGKLLWRVSGDESAAAPSVVAPAFARSAK